MRVKKVLTIVLIIIFLLSCNPVHAIADQAEGFVELGESSEQVFETDVATDGFEDLAGLLLGIGIFVAVAVGIVLGIKFMFSAPEARAEVSKLMIPYVVGTVIVVGALTIWKVAIELLSI